MTTDTTRAPDEAGRAEFLAHLHLKHGGHKSIDDGACLLEAVAYIAGEPHSDHPACTDPVLGAYGRAVNDFMTDSERELLAPLVPKLVGTACDHTVSLRRAMLLVDGTIRQILPLAFDGIKLPDVAKMLRDLQPIIDESTASAADSAADSAACSAADSAACSAANAARTAACNAAYSAANAANAARTAACNAAYSAARSAASAARSAAYSAAYSAADAACSAACAAYNAARSAACSAASAARKPVCDAIVQLFNAAIEIK